MPKKETALNKAIVQDWNALAAMNDTTLHIRALTTREIAALVSMCQYLKWQTRFDNPPSQDILDAFSAETEYDLTHELDLCELLEPCLTPITDALAALQAQNDAMQLALSAVQESVNGVTETQDNNAAQEIPPVSSEVPDEICGAATAAVEFMHGFNNDLYNKAELSTVDNANEAISRIISAIPLFNELPFDELFALSNTMFENQVVAYNADYVTAKDTLIQALNCRIRDNGGVFNYDLWAAWLNAIDAEIPDNAAAKLFARYSPLRQTWLNQIAAFFNKNASLQSYFDQVSTAYAGGLLNPVIGCDDCPTVTPLWRIITPGHFVGGNVTTINHYNGTFSITAVAGQGTDGTYRLAFNDANLSCWQFTDVDYDRTPASFSGHYDCGSTASGDDYTPGSAEGPVINEGCYGGIIASDTGAGFVVRATVTLCP